ncbi:hypothetical protein GW17_00049725, partial [Ensete ventricosum]
FLRIQIPCDLRLFLHKYCIASARIGFSKPATIKIPQINFSSFRRSGSKDLRYVSFLLGVFW